MATDLFTLPAGYDESSANDWKPLGYKPEPAAPELRPYQLDVLNRARGQIGRGRKRGIIQGETGSGKTYVIAELARCAAAKSTRTLILADRRRLISQIGETLRRFDVPYGVIMAGSTRTTHAPVILASRDTLAAWDERGFDVAPFGVILTDEAHKGMGDTYQRLYRLFPNSAHVGFTATPARGDGRSLGDFFQWLECTVPASQLIAEGWLVRPEVYAPPELAKRRRQGTKSKGLAGDPVAHWGRHAAGLPTIAFSAKVVESIALRDRFREAGIAAEHIDGTADDDERERKFARLAAGEIKVLCSVKLLIEGVDIPEVAAAILWAPFGSPIEYRQACGRIMRPAPGKARAVILDHSGAAGVHGAPGDDVDWSLDADSSLGQRRKDAIKDGRKLATIYCRKCGLAFQGMACPQCGWQAPQERKRPAGGTAGEVYEATDEVLSRYDGERAAGYHADALGRQWKRCIAIACARGQKAGAAAAMFSNQTGRPPWDAGVSPLPDGRGDWQRPAADVFPGFARRQGVAS